MGYALIFIGAFLIIIGAVMNLRTPRQPRWHFTADGSMAMPTGDHTYNIGDGDGTTRIPASQIKIQ